MKKRYTSLFVGVMALSMMFGTANAQQLTKQNKTSVVNNVQHITTGANAGTYRADLTNHNHSGHCASDALMEDYLQQTGKTQWYANEQARMNYEAQNFQGSRVAYTIPVIFHVIYSNGSENVSNALIQQLLDELNDDYQLMNADAANARSAFGFVPANADISFCLAMRDPQNQPLAEPGVHRVSTSVTYFDPDVNTNDMKYTSSGGTEAWNRNNYLNVWICDITNGATFGTAGYAYKPGISSIGIPSDIDGIVIDYNIGTTANSNVLTHEVGHYLGLSHTWGNSNQAAGCSDDDGLSDTPNTAGPSFDYSGSCSGNQTTCGSTQTMYENYMDYSNCTCMFTTEQVNLMSSVLANSRNSLTSSNACTPVNPQPPVADFSADVTTILQNGSVNFTDLSTNYPTSWQWTITPSAGTTFLGSTSTDQDVTVQFANTGTYTVELTATNGQGSDTETKTSYITVVSSGGGAITCDTLRNYTAPEAANMTAYTVTGNAGYYPGHHTLNTGAFSDAGLAEPFTVASPTEVRAIRLPVYQIDDMGAADNLTINVYTDVASAPGSVIGSHTIALTDIDAGYWNVIEFTTPVAVSGNFWVALEWDYTGTFDTLVFATVDFNDRAGATSTTMMNIESGIGWNNTGTIFGGINTSLILDVLTSTGPSPVAVISAPTTACEGVDVPMNGYGSSNAGSFYWLLDDSANSGPYYDGNANTNYSYWAETWTIELYAEGSCQTDMATTSLVVNPEITTTISQTSENCNASDGQITFSGTSGGDGGAYNFSINNGATTVSGATGTNFTGLVAGTYNCVVTDGSGCEYTAQQNVTRINNFTVTASATPSTTINQGQSVTLDATAGGVDYTWFEGNVTIATTQSTSASPQMTTTYIVNAIDANGCEASDQITITVILGLDDSEIGKFVNVFPNPSNGTINLAVGFEATKNINVEILNMFGQVIQTRDIQGVSSGIYQFDLSNEAEGFYLLRINDGKEVFTTRISKVD
ncbi:MAG: T9SS type A sorting domain-containing protein [Crocinitomicaceae bacterium]|nr:T9SS type A sorting domain-containing protein [Crocinitomicaceae bacterium]